MYPLKNCVPFIRNKYIYFLPKITYVCPFFLSKYRNWNLEGSLTCFLFPKRVVIDPASISVLGLMEFDRKETSFDLEFLAVNLQF
jgi:hypothetical protein